jgi:hypothetical protein
MTRAAAWVCFTVLVTSTPPMRAQPAWTEFAPPDAGFAVELPRTPQKTADGQYMADIEGTVLMVQVSAHHPGIIRILARGDRQEITGLLETSRDEGMKGVNGKVRSFSFADFNGHPAAFVTFDVEFEGKPFVGTERIVLADRNMYVLIAISPSEGNASAERFHRSFRLIADANAAAMRTISFTEAVCDRIPPVPITFQMPGDFEARRVGGIEGGCLWGAKDDLDRVTVKPNEGDFRSLRRGVFRARVSSDVVCSPETGVFDQTDGLGEAGLRRNLDATGAKVIVWKKETIAGLPALQIVADVFGSRVYMLYLGNTNFISNAMLVNYYHPANQTPADDTFWAEFVAGIKAAKAP